MRVMCADVDREVVLAFGVLVSWFVAICDTYQGMAFEHWERNALAELLLCVYVMVKTTAM